MAIPYVEILIEKQKLIRKLYESTLKIYTHDVQTTFSLEKGGVLAWQFIERKKFPVFVPHQFAIKEVDTNGVLTHPERFPGGAWVYLPVDPTFNQLHTGLVEQVVSQRLLSTSFIAAMPSASQVQMKQQFEKLVYDYTGKQAQDEISFPYRTYAYHYQKLVGQ